MLDHFSIITTGGLVLWSKSYTNTGSPFNILIQEALIEQRSTSQVLSDSDVSKWDRDSYSILWTLANELELVFVVAYQRILQLTYVEELLQIIKQTFIAAFPEIIKSIIDLSYGKRASDLSLSVELTSQLLGNGWNQLFKGWDSLFSKILRELEQSAKTKKPRAASSMTVEAEKEPALLEATTPTNVNETPLDSETIARNIAALKTRQKAKKASRKNAAGSEIELSESEVRKKKVPAKSATKWHDSKVTAADMAAFDYSSDMHSSESGASTPAKADGLISTVALGTRTKSGLYEVADYQVNSDDDEDIDLKLLQTRTAKAEEPQSRMGSFWSMLTFSPKVLTKADLEPTLIAMREHLMSKNVARDIADKICEGVGKTLEGRKLGSFGSIKNEVKLALEANLVNILTPKTSTDILLDINRKKASFAVSGKEHNPTPYAITFVGVNGVGKSTNLSKVAFWLLQNKLRVLIAACDTFRSGAVEQLRVHVQNLGQLGEQTGGIGLVEGGVKMVELYERGYGKDASGIAKDAISYGRENGFDVVLIDTAGRMQDNEPLMRALAKLVAVNNPDKIIFVGEALVGNEAVDQLVKFNRSLRNFSGVRNPRGIDGMILTKFDTIDDKVGAALSMTYVTGQPIFFVGTGQTYSDLRSLKVSHIVQALLQR